MLQVQQESINDFKKMITLLLEKSKSPKGLSHGGSSSKHSKGINKEGESTCEKIDAENNFNYEIPKFSSEEEENSEKKNG